MIFLRLDDVGMDNDKFEIMHNIILDLELPCTYAVVPKYLTSELASKIRLPFIECVMHGYSHENHSEGEKSEFCDGRSFDLQFEDLKSAKGLFDSFLPPTKVFVPPWHHMNEDTAKALRQLGFTHLSLSELEKSRIEGRISHDFDSSFMHYYYDPTDHEDDVLLLKKCIALSKQHYVGLLLHHNLLNSPKAINRTRQFLTLLKRSAEKFNIELKTLSQL